MNDITALAQTEINDALAQLKQLSEYPTPFTQYARVLRKYITSLVEALEKAQSKATQQGNIACELFDEVTQLRRSADDKAPELRAQLIEADSELEALRQRIAELEKAATEPVAWTDEQELRDVERNGCGYLFTVNPITPNADPRRVIKLYTVPPAMESLTVTVKLPEVRITIAESKLRNLTYQQLDAYNAGATRAAVKLSQALTAAGIQVIEGDAPQGV